MTLPKIKVFERVMGQNHLTGHLTGYIPCFSRIVAQFHKVKEHGGWGEGWHIAQRNCLGFTSSCPGFDTWHFKNHNTNFLMLPGQINNSLLNVRTVKAK